jgi:choline-sulfatase
MKSWIQLYFLAATLLSACSDDRSSHEVAKPAEHLEKPDVVLISIDTARADRFSYTGSPLVDTPWVDSIAAQGAGFLQAVSPVPITLPAHVSLFTGKNPNVHGIRSNGFFHVPEDETTLAEILQEAGYATAAFVGAAVLDTRYGLSQGFEHYDDRMNFTDEASQASAFAQRRGEEVVDAALGWLSNRERSPTFVWLHLFDPHAPYSPPEPERSQHPSSPYNGEVAYTDRVIGKFLTAYKKLGRYENAIVVITSDHGEGLGEHGESTHGIFLYDATVRVPLVLAGPGIRPGAVVEDQVSLIDIFPTVLDLLGLETPPHIAGETLLSTINLKTTEKSERIAYIESLYARLHYGWAGFRGIRQSNSKLIVGREAELYDLDDDPREESDLAPTQPGTIEELRNTLDSNFPETRGLAENRIEVDGATQRQLAALGYASTSIETEAEPNERLPDPRDKIRVLQKKDRALALFNQGQHQEAIRLAESCVEEEPGSGTFAKYLAHMYKAEGRFGEALAELSRAIELSPQESGAWTAKGEIFEAMGKPDETIAAYAEAIAADPSNRAARHNRWGVMLQRRENNAVLEEASALLRTQPQHGEALWASARVQFDGSDQAMIDALEAALTLAPEDPTLSLELAKKLEARGDTRRVEGLYRSAMQRLGLQSEVAFRLGRLLVDDRRWQEALTVVNGSLRSGRTPELLLLLSEIQFHLNRPGDSLELVREAARLAPERADVWVTLGGLEMNQGNLPNALQAYQKAVALGLDSEHVRRQLTAINSRL